MVEVDHRIVLENTIAVNDAWVCGRGCKEGKFTTFEVKGNWLNDVENECMDGWINSQGGGLRRFMLEELVMSNEI
jgi:hypothetical protein